MALSRCPVCGSLGCVDLSAHKLPKVKCSRCGCKGASGVVRERDFELALVDWNCKRCRYQWSSACVLPVEFVVGFAFWSVYNGCEKYGCG